MKSGKIKISVENTIKMTEENEMDKKVRNIKINKTELTDKGTKINKPKNSFESQNSDT